MRIGPQISKYRLRCLFTGIPVFPEILIDVFDVRNLLSLQTEIIPNEATCIIISTIFLYSGPVLVVIPDLLRARKSHKDEVTDLVAFSKS